MVTVPKMTFSTGSLAIQELRNGQIDRLGKESIEILLKEMV